MRRHPAREVVLSRGDTAESVDVVLPTDGRVRFLPMPRAAHVLARTLREALDER